jgi:hypothetical protein
MEEIANSKNPEPASVSALPPAAGGAAGGTATPPAPGNWIENDSEAILP